MPKPIEGDLEWKNRLAATSWQREREGKNNREKTASSKRSRLRFGRLRPLGPTVCDYVWREVKKTRDEDP